MMSENNSNNRNETVCSNDKYVEKEKLQNILSESLLLNTDIFSNEYEEEVEESLEEVEAEEAKDEAKENESGLTNQELKVDFKDDSFILSVEENNEETDIQRSKKEFNEFMRRNQRKGENKGNNKTLIYTSKVKQEKESIKKIKELKIKPRFDFIKRPINKKDCQARKNDTLFNFNEIDLGQTKRKRIPNREFSMNILENKQSQFNMDLDREKKAKGLIKIESSLKVEDL